MKSLLIASIMVGGMLGATGCRTSASSLALQIATVRVPGSVLVVAVERTLMHSDLAENHRAALLREGARDLVRVQMFDDTGGYSRTNLYRADSVRFVLVDAEASYEIDVSRRDIRRDAKRRVDAAARGTYLGTFDVDSSRVWRFIPASDAGERPVEFSGGR